MCGRYAALGIMDIGHCGQDAILLGLEQSWCRRFVTILLAIIYPFLLQGCHFRYHQLLHMLQIAIHARTLLLWFHFCCKAAISDTISYRTCSRWQFTHAPCCCASISDARLPFQTPSATAHTADGNSRTHPAVVVPFLLQGCHFRHHQLLHMQQMAIHARTLLLCFHFCCKAAISDTIKIGRAHV